MFRARTINEKTVQAAISGSGDIVSFENAFEKPLSSLIINIDPVQSGEGEPSPSNIRPISGWAGANIGDNSKNFFPQNYRGISTVRGLSLEYGTDGSVHISGTSTNTSFTVEQLSLPFVLPKGTYTLSGVNSTAAADLLYGRVRGYKNGAASYIIQSGNGTFTLNEAQTVDIAIAIRATISPDVTFYPMIRLATETDATYEPYNGDTYPITWSDTAGTVYDGTLDVVRGKLTADYKYVADLSTLTWSKVDGTSEGIQMFRTSAISDMSDTGTRKEGLICDRYKATEVLTAITQIDAYSMMRYAKRIYCRDDNYTDAATFKASLVGAQLVYKLATPIEYDLDPVTINTLLGQNNVWADTGDIASLKVDAVTGKLKFKLKQ